MSKAQTDIRTTSYDADSARPYGYVGTIEDVLAQIRAEPTPVKALPGYGRRELLRFLGVNKSKTELSGVQAPAYMPGVYIFPMNDEEDDSVVYGAPEASAARRPRGFYTLANAMKRWPANFAAETNQDIADRLGNLTDSQLLVFRAYRVTLGVRASLAMAEAYPYPSDRAA